MKIDALTPVLTAAPGGQATCRLRIENTETGPASYALRVVGFDEEYVQRPPHNGPLAVGGAEEVDLGFTIPVAFAAGRHWVAVEVASDRPGSKPAVVGVTVEVGNIDQVAVAVVPSTVRGRRRGRFFVDIDNRADKPVDLDLAGEGPRLDVKLKHEKIRLFAGARIRMKGRVKGPWHVVGEPRQHAFTITAHNQSVPSYAPATFHQRSLLPHSLRTMLMLLTVVAVWAAALGAGYLWLNERNDDESSEATLIDTDGDGKPDTPGNELVDTDGDGIADTPVRELVDTDGDGKLDTPGDKLIDTDGDGTPDRLASEVAEEVANGGADIDRDPDDKGGPEQATHVVVGGTVKAGNTGDDADVLVTLTPLSLGEQGPATAAFVGGAGRSTPMKLWPARFGRHEIPGMSSIRQTESIESKATRGNGAWQFGRVAIGQRYEVNFAKTGFDSQSFIVEPPEDGSAVELDVELEPATGELDGSVSGPAGRLGNVAIVVTDGTLTFATHSDTGDDAGEWSLSGISTPGTYTLTATLAGYGTEVMPITLEPGQRLGGVDIAMRPGVAAILGRISTGGQPFGGVTVTASNGEVTRTTTSLTDGDTGLYSFPGLDLGGRYTVTASVDGYSTQSRLVELSDNRPGVDFVMTKTTATITGVVVSNTKGRLPGAAIKITHEDLVFTSESAAAPDTGSFTIDDLEPGSYLVTFSRFDHRPESRLITLAAGEVRDLREIELRFRPRSDIAQPGSLEVRVVDSLGENLTGATVRLTDVGTGKLVDEKEDDDDNQASFVFEDVKIGTYMARVSHGKAFRPATRRVSIGLGRQSIEVMLFKKGQVSGRIVDSLTGGPREPSLVQLDDYEVTIFRLNPDGSEKEVDRAIVAADQPPDEDGEVRWESHANVLTTGRYRIEVSDPPPAYAVEPDQVLIEDEPPMQFEILPQDDDPIPLADIEADIFPDLRGAIRGPEVNTAGDVEWAPINAADLIVRLQCNGGPWVEPTELLDGDDDGKPDGYHYTPLYLQENDLRGSCKLRVTADGYETTTHTLTEPLVPSDGLERSDQVVDVNVRVFPTLSGRVRAPQLDPIDGDVTFEPINAANLRVAVACDGRPPVEAELSDGGGGSEPDTYNIDRLIVQQSNLTGRCTFTFSAAGYVTTELVRQLQPTGIDRFPIQVNNVALFRPGDIAGRVYWVDRGIGPNERKTADDIAIRTQGDVIIGFLPARSEGGEPVPDTSEDPLSTTSDDGDWAFIDPKQVFGRTSYVFNHEDYVTRTIEIEIDEDSRQVRSVIPPTGLGLTDNPGEGIRVELNADGGEIRGDITVHTIKATPNIGGFEMDVEGAADYSDTFEPTGPDTGSALVVTDDPGTYDATIDPPDFHHLLPATPTETDTESLFQLPGESLDFSRTYVEHAALTVETRLEGPSTPLIIEVDNMSITHTNNGELGDPDTETHSVTNANGVGEFVDLPVNTEFPETEGVDYVVPLPTMNPTIFDIDNASYSIGGGTPEPCGPDRCADLAVPLLAGESNTVTFIVPRFGTLRGNVLGDLDNDTLTDDDQVNLRIGDPDVGERLTVKAQRVADFNGTPIPPPFPDAEITAVVDPNDPDGFVFSGRSGYYTITPTDPFYDPDPLDEPDSEHPLPPQQPVFLMGNGTDRDVGTWILKTKLGELSINAIEFPSGLDISGAEVTLTDSDDVDHTPDPNDTDANGNLIVPNLLPDDYTIEIHKTDGTGEETHFPVIATVNVPQGAEVNDRKRIVEAHLPQVGGLVGTVGALNRLDDPVPLPDPLAVTRSCMPEFPDVKLSGPDTTTVPNEAPDPDAACRAGTAPQAVLEPIPADHTMKYTFAEIGPGAYTITFSDEDGTADGYDTPDPAPATAVPPSTTVSRVNYRALDRQVVVTLPATAHGTFVVGMTSPDGNPYTPTSPDGRVFTFDDVAPEVGDDFVDFDPFTVIIDGEFHAPLTKLVDVPPGDPDVAVPVTVAASDLDGDATRIRGIARKQTGAGTGTISPISSGGTAHLIEQPLGEVVASYPLTNSDGHYEFDLTETEIHPTGYKVRVELEQFAPESSATFSPIAGEVKPVPDIIVKALATFNITVTGPPVSDITVAIVAPATPPAGVIFLQTGNLFQFKVDPDVNWGFKVSAPAYVSKFVDSTSPPDAPAVVPINPTPGQVVNRPVALVARTVSGAVITPAFAQVADANVRATGAPNPERSDQTASNGSYSFTNFLTGDWVFVAEKIGVGRDRVPNTGNRVIGDTEATPITINFALAARAVNVGFTVTGNGGTALPGVNIVLTKPDGDDSGTAPDEVATGTTGAGGTATLSGVETDIAPGAPLSWRATAPSGLVKTGQIPFTAINDGTTIDDLLFTVPVATITLAMPTVSGSVTGTGSALAIVFACPGENGNCGENTQGVETDEADATGAFSLVPTSTGIWRMRAVGTNGQQSQLENFTVSTSGVLSPPNPFELPLPPPPPPPGP